MTGYSVADFKLDWTTRLRVCPQGKLSKSWTELTEATSSAKWEKQAANLKGAVLTPFYEPA